jgi:hypothetical protein
VWRDTGVLDRLDAFRLTVVVLGSTVYLRDVFATDREIGVRGVLEGEEVRVIGPRSRLEEGLDREHFSVDDRRIALYRVAGPDLLAVG